MKNTTHHKISFVCGQNPDLSGMVSSYIAARLQEHIDSGESVFWLVPGGSAIKIAIETAKRLKPPLKKLTVSLSDERFGPVGHADSNWKQLLDGGFLLPEATLIPVLINEDLDKTSKNYAQNLKKALSASDFSLALVGIGADGHALGIKPGSPAIDSDELAEGYEWDDFTRLTATPKAIARLDEVVVYAVGDEKHPQIENLAKDLPISIQPAQALKSAKRLTVYNDYMQEVI